MNTPGKAMAAALLCVALGAPAAPAAAVTAAAEAAPAAQGEAVITMRLDGEISVDPQGRVHDYKIRTDLTPGVRALLDRVIPTWRFEPVVVGDKPVIARAPMRVVVAATQGEGGYRIQIDNVLFMPNSEEEYAAEKKLRDAQDGYSITRVQMRPPTYPSQLLHAGVGGVVLLNVLVSPDGSVEDVAAVQSSLLDVRGRARQLEPGRLILERNAVANARSWKFRIDAADARALSASARTLRVPVEYMIDRPGNRDLTGAWRHEFRGPNTPAPWLRDGRDPMVVGVSDLTSGEMLSGSPSLRLLNRDQALGVAAP
jgi:TonB family protein